jgi:hypothetical protein
VNPDPDILPNPAPDCCGIPIRMQTKAFYDKKKIFDQKTVNICLLKPLQMIFLLYLWELFWPAWFRIQIPKPDPDPLQGNPFESGSETLVQHFS